MRLLKKLPDNVLPFEKPALFSIECQDNLHYMRSLPDESMHLIVSSPPYNLGNRMKRRDQMNSIQSSSRRR